MKIRRTFLVVVLACEVTRSFCDRRDQRARQKPRTAARSWTSCGVNSTQTRRTRPMALGLLHPKWSETCESRSTEVRRSKLDGVSVKRARTRRSHGGAGSERKSFDARGSRWGPRESHSWSLNARRTRTTPYRATSSFSSGPGYCGRVTGSARQDSCAAASCRPTNGIN